MIQRYNVSGQYGASVYIDECDDGSMVLHKDFLCVVEQLEYDIRYYREQLEIVKEERNFYEDKFNELYEQNDLFSIKDTKDY